MLTTIVLIALPAFAGLASTSPMRLDALSSTEVVYLSHCASGLPEAPALLVGDYYSSIAESHNGETPTAESNGQGPLDGHPYYDIPPWEGRSQDLYFPDSGVTFTSHIKSNADKKSVGDYAGWGNNGHDFDCYRDTDEVLYTQDDGFGHTKTCTKNYYCLPM